MKSKENKEVKTSKKHELTKTEKVVDFLDQNRKFIYGAVGGIIVTAIVATIIWPDRIATLSDGKQPVATINEEVITADTLYEDMKKYYSVSLLLDRIDDMLLSEKYEETDEMNEELEKTANNYYSQYEQYYGLSKEKFLAQYGFSSHDEFIENLRLNYRRNEYYEDYVESLITDKEIEDYYDKEVYGDISSEHLLVTIDDDRTEEEAKKLAEEIITKLKDGKTFDEVKAEYADKITYENLKYQGFNSNIQDSYMNALKGLKDDAYTTTPVKTTYGYHIIHRIDQKEKASLEDTKDAIIEMLAAKKKSADKNLYYKALAHLREENNLEFSDTVMKEKYKNYLDQNK